VPASQLSRAQGVVEQTVLASPLLNAVLERWDRIALPDCWLVAGAVAQTVWNKAHDLPAIHGIKDVDITYFDGSDLSEEGELAHAARVEALFADFPVHFDVKNEARVHTWYARKFGFPIQPYTSTRHAIATFPTTATSVGIRPAAAGLELYAPFGVSDLEQLIVRPNKALITREIYLAKVNRWKGIWPLLKMLDWDGVSIP
jgi:uncharacterized protein